MTMCAGETLRLTVGALMSRTGEKQRDLATAIGLTQTQISRKQSGQVSWSLADCDRLAAHWAISVPDLLSGPTHAAALLPDNRLAPGRGTALSAPTDLPPLPGDEPVDAPAPMPGDDDTVPACQSSL
ncbi:helix-turn-helix transcriptional regulator [Streptomyces sp. SL13]|uniref:Helix-turn-helix transcriptional regulator n=1 Tax=Streptantibioticus silvisoli TaxID=2705255 RepID=A0AA90H7K5_9ACTN|nr:helix-turn-helix transcriptional regulator [Streptantibioticus silvisoli]MDI5969427.1 helix-turn-helix transcriptional regulator [Streptantibioticus silvisoli]